MRLSVAAVFTLLLAAAYTASAQDTRGAIFGTVADSTSAIIAGATVTIVNTDTNVSITVATNSTGYYEANLLIAGTYRVTAEQPGFRRSVQDSVELPVSSRIKIDHALTPGQVSESVVVTADATALETTSVSSGAVMGSREILDLPNAAFATPALGLLTPGINSAYSLGDSTFGLHSGGATGSYFTAGGVGGNEWSIDGTPNNGSGRGIAYNPLPELVQEMKVDTSGFDASVGHSTGVNMAIMTRNGTNKFHGTVREAHRQSRWQAMRLFQKQTYYQQINQALAAGDEARASQLRNTPGLPSGRQNNYAATLGGPVVLPGIVNGKDKLFFFFGFGGFLNSYPNFTQQTVPSVANRNGDFSNLLAVNPGLYQLYDPLTTAPDPTRPNHFVRQPFAGNILPASRIFNPTYKFYSGTLPLPNTAVDPRLDPVRNLNYNYSQEQAYNSYANRIDYNHSTSNRFFVRWSYNRWDNKDPGWQSLSPTPGLGNTFQGRGNVGITLDWVRTLGPSTLLDIAVAGNQYTNESYPGRVDGQYKSFKPSDVGLPAYLDAKAGDDPVLPFMNWTGYSNINLSKRAAQRYRTNSLKADLTSVHGKHSFRAGADLRGQFFTNVAPGNTSGSFSFTSYYTQRTDDGFTPAGGLGHSWAAFMLGYPVAVSIPTNDSSAMSNQYYAGFVQDSWRPLRNLSVTLGLRMEYENGLKERYNRMIGYMDLNAKLPITDAAQAAYAQAPIPEMPVSRFRVNGGSIYPGSGSAGSRIWSPSYLWLPKVAVAWQVQNKTVIRAGYGVFYDTLNAMNQGPSADQSFYSRSTSPILTANFGEDLQSGTSGIMADPFPVRADGTRFDTPLRNALGLMTKAGRGWTFSPYDRPRPRQQRWRAGVQRQLGSTMVLDVSYTGSYSNGIPLNQSLSALPEQYWATGTVRNDSVATNLNANVTNPFYIGNFPDLKSSNPVLYNDMLTNAFFTRPTVAKSALLRPYPQMNGLVESLPLGEVKTHALEITVARRFSKGLSLNAGFARLKNDARDIFLNEFDASPTWRTSNVGRPMRLTGSSVYELPFGKGRAFARAGLWNHLFGGFQISVTYEYQPGALVDFGNLFYYGDLNAIAKDEPVIAQWFSTAGFERNAAKGPAAFHSRIFPTRVDGVRWQSTNNWNSAVQRKFRLHEGVSLHLRGDFMNLQNRSQLAGPVTNPFSTDFGKVVANTFLENGEGGASNRWIQVMARIQF